MPDRKEAEIVHDSGDSTSQVHELDMNMLYGLDYLPKGYARTSPVEQHVCPSDCDSNTPG